MQIEIKKRYVYGLMFLLVVGVVMGYGSTNPTIFGHSNGEVEGTVPSGFCIFSAGSTSCPTGWTASTAFHERTIRALDPNQVATSEFGTTGGTKTHSHSNAVAVSQGGGSQTAGGYNTITASSSWPPYVNVLVCCKN